MDGTIIAVSPVGTASGRLHIRTELGGIQQETYAGVPIGLFVIRRNGFRLAEIERTFDGWAVRVGDRTDMSVGVDTLGTYPSKSAALNAWLGSQFPHLKRKGAHVVVE